MSATVVATSTRMVIHSEGNEAQQYGVQQAVQSRRGGPERRRLSDEMCTASPTSSTAVKSGPPRALQIGIETDFGDDLMCEKRQSINIAPDLGWEM